MRSIRDGTSIGRWASLSGIRFRILTYAALGVAWTLPFWLHPSACPFGLHDWAYPCFPEQGRSYLYSLVSPWWDTDLGHAHPIPQITPPWLILGALIAASPAIGLRCFLVAAFAAAAVAGDIAADRLFGAADPRARWIAGVLYAASPFLATKLASGHLGFIACAPLVPFALVAFDAIAARGVRAWAAAALCAISAFAQMQVGIVLLALLPLFALRRSSAAWWMGLWAVAFVAWLPAVFASSISLHDGAFAPETQLAAWLTAKSVPWQHTIDGTAYFTGYFQLAAPWQSFLAWRVVAPACIVIALARRGAPRLLASASIVLGAVATGTAGPLAAPVGWATAHVPAATIFREFYDLLFLAPLAIAGGAAIAVDFAARSLPNTGVLRPAALVACIVATATLVAPAALGGSAALVPLGDEPRLAAQAHASSEIPGDDRILWLPATSPLGPIGTPGGADPYQVPVGDHPAASAFHATGVLAYADSLADRGDFVSPSLLDRLDVADVIVRPGVLTFRLSTAAHPQGRAIAPATAPRAALATSILALAPGMPSCEPDLRNAMAAGLRAYVRCDPRWAVAPFEDSANVGDDPNAEWVQGERWALLDPELADPRWPVVFSRSAHPFAWSQPARGTTLVYAPRGAAIDGTSIGPSPAWQRIATNAGAHVLHGPGGAIAALSATLPAPTVSIPSGSAEQPVSTTRSNRYLGTFTAELAPHGPALLVLRQGWSQHWRAEIGGVDAGRPMLTDGYAAGWKLPTTTAPTVVTVEFDAATPYLALLALSWALMTALAVIAATRPRPSITGRPPSGRR